MRGAALPRREQPHTCGSCGARWAGSSTAHCAAQCHLTFTTVNTFDRHRVNGECRDPADSGLHAYQRAGYIAWGYPPDIERKRESERPETAPDTIGTTGTGTVEGPRPGATA